MPTCTNCRIYKDSTQFFKCLTKKNKLTSQCKKCRYDWHSKYTKFRRKTDPEWVIKRNEIARNSRKNNPARYKKYELKKTAEQHYKWGLKHRFGMTLDDYNEILYAQKGVCKICGKKDLRIDKKGNKVKLAVDHCHKTGRVRGLLCGSCNGGLGLFRDDINLLKQSIIYLQNN